MTRDEHRLLVMLAPHIGARLGVSAAALARAVFGPDAGPRDERRIRHLVVELRKLGHHICAHPTAGYYMAASDAELDATCEFLLGRAMTSLKQISAMKRVSLPDLAGQMNIRLEDREQ